MEKIILRSDLSPGDTCVLTAALKMLAEQHADKFELGFKGVASELFANNPYIKTDEGREVTCHYPLIHQSNQRPVSFLQGHVDFLSKALRVKLELTQNHPDIHLSTAEKESRGMIYESTGLNFPYWVLVAGGKHDFTLKWWVDDRWQQLVDTFKDKICFVQVGAPEHHHPDLKGVIDARGTDIRGLINLIYHSQGVVCPVTFPMHLSAGTTTKHSEYPRRPCVVIAGGREPVHWELYPWHRHIHTVGALQCCATGGCWKSRENDCEQLVSIESSPDRDWPRCMDIITVERVAGEILSYFVGGQQRYLTEKEAEAIRQHYES